MAAKERRLLDREPLNRLYEVTDPKLIKTPTMHTVISRNNGPWEIEDSHSLCGYRACKRTLESKVNRYESSGIWPSQCQIAIGLFEQGNLFEVLIAKNLGYKPAKQVVHTLPLADALNAIGLSRKDVL